MGLPEEVQAGRIADLQAEWTIRWHESRASAPGLDGGSGTLLSLVLAQHGANFDLWHEEDQARSPVATNAQIAQVKRNIDQLNQTRNDLMEQIDEATLKAFPGMNPDAPQHSETPGMIVDRLSILALKVYHAREQAERVSAGRPHVEKNKERLAVLEMQRRDLTECLRVLFSELAGGKRRFKVYRQMKMYNDPASNPAIYGAGVIQEPGKSQD